MNPSEKQLQQPGPLQELWVKAAVRERFRLGELLDEWIDANAHADPKTFREVKRAALELQDAAKPALDADDQPAYRLGTSERLKVLRAVGAQKAREVLEQMPASKRTEAEKLLAELLAGGDTPTDTQDRQRLVALTQLGPMASAAGATVRVDAEAVRQQVNSLDFLTLVGGPALHRFVGRADQLATLHTFWHSWGAGLVFIEAPGGMGKSMLISRFLADLLETPEARPTAIFHIDFDRRDMHGARPATILFEMLRQAPRWVRSDRSEVARRRVTTVQRASSHDYHAQSRGVESISDLADQRLYSLIDLFDCGEGDLRFIIVADSAEQVFGFDDVAAESPYTVACDLKEILEGEFHPHRRTQVLVIYAARCVPSVWEQRPALRIALDVLSPDEAKAYLRAEAALAGASVDGDILCEVIEAVGRAPLALRLAARLLASEDARTDPKSWVKAVHDDPERIQATLYDRILKRLHDPNVRKLAKPGLLVRRLTPAVVEQVLAGPCNLSFTEITPEQLIAESAREGQLFFRDSSDPEPRALWHRPDVRALMLPDLDATIDAKLAAAINTAAAGYYARHDDEVSRAEELYHRLRLDEPESELASRWTEAAGERLKRALDEFPKRARDFVRSRLGAASLVEVEARLEQPNAGQLPAEAQPLAELRSVVRHELQRGEAPLETLARYKVDTLDGVLGDAYAEALVASGQVSKLLAEARNLLARKGIAPPSVRAAVFATTAGVLEGQGKLREALVYWSEAHTRPFGPQEEAILAELGSAVGWLRTRRKLGLIEGRGLEVKRLAQGMEHHWLALISAPVLLRELLAELGDILYEPSTPAVRTYMHLLGVLFDTEEAFPSVVADPQRLGLLCARLGFDWVHSLRMLGDVTVKVAYQGGEFANLLVSILREEVDWTLVKAVSRPQGAVVGKIGGQFTNQR